MRRFRQRARERRGSSPYASQRGAVSLRSRTAFVCSGGLFAGARATERRPRPRRRNDRLATACRAGPAGPERARTAVGLSRIRSRRARCRERTACEDSRPDRRLDRTRDDARNERAEAASRVDWATGYSSENPGGKRSHHLPEVAMRFELLNTIGTLLTVIIIGATAIAAMVQLRHLRAGNQITAMLSIGNNFDASSYRDAIALIGQKLDEALADPAFRSYEIAWPRGLRPPEVEPEFVEIRRAAILVGNTYEELGLLVKTGIVDQGLFLSTTGAIFWTSGNSSEPTPRSCVKPMGERHCGKTSNTSRRWPRIGETRILRRTRRGFGGWKSTIRGRFLRCRPRFSRSARARQVFRRRNERRQATIGCER